MNLESDKRLNIQLRLDFPSAPTGEARQAGREDIESLSVVSEPECPADTLTRQRNFSNRRIRTRMYGGVGGVGPRGSPLSRSMARIFRLERCGKSAAIWGGPVMMPRDSERQPLAHNRSV